jgi:hypothetical protein
VQLALTEDRTDVTAGNDPDRVAFTHVQAHKATLAQHAAKLVAQRQHTIELIGSIPLDRYDRTASNRRFDELNVIQQLRVYCRNDWMHAAQLESRDSDYTPGAGRPSRPAPASKS